MCGIDIFIVFFNRQNQKFTEFNSDPSFDSKVVDYLLNDTNRLQFTNKKYSNSDYVSFCNDNSKDYFSESGEEGSDQKRLCSSDLADFSLKLKKYILPEKQSKLAQSRYQKQLDHDNQKIKNLDELNFKYF